MKSIDKNHNPQSNPSLIRKYQQDGFVAPVLIYSKQEIQHYQSQFSQMEKQLGHQKEQYQNLHFYFPWAREMATHPKLLDLVESIIGPDVLIYGSLVLSKQPNTSAFISWHQDGHYFNDFATTQYLSAWIALSESTVSNGCMRVIPGSHQQGILVHQPCVKQGNLIRQNEQIDITPRPSLVCDVELHPGEVSLHHAATIHHSPPNQSQSKRTGLIIRFVDATIKNPPKPLLHARGSALLNGFPQLGSIDGLSTQASIDAFVRERINTR
jgi:non-heme Fe2+,alpha-ketoglutarate-dependent halogenase